MLYLIEILVCLSSIVSAAVDIAQEFKNFNLVPDSHPVPPTKLLTLIFNTSTEPIQIGAVTYPFQIRNTPKVIYDADPNKYYTVIMLTPDAPSEFSNKMKYALFWLVMNVPGANVERGETIVEYAVPPPTNVSGKHRLVMTVHEQLTGLLDLTKERRVPERNLIKRLFWPYIDFLEKKQLSQPIFGLVFLGVFDDYSILLIKEYAAQARIYYDYMPWPMKDFPLDKAK